MARAVDAVDAAVDREPSAVGERERDVAVGPEALLGGDHPGAAGGDVSGVVVEPEHQLVLRAAAGRSPSTRRGRCGPSARSGRRCSIEQLGQPRAMVRSVHPCSSGCGELAGDHLAVEAVEHLVQHVAAIERRDRQLVARLLDGSHPEQVLHEVGVRAGRPRLELGRRHGRVERGTPAPLRSPSNSVRRSLRRARAQARGCAPGRRRLRVRRPAPAIGSGGQHLRRCAAAGGARWRGPGTRASSSAGGVAGDGVGCRLAERRRASATGWRMRGGAQVAARCRDDDARRPSRAAPSNWRWARAGDRVGCRRARRRARSASPISGSIEGGAGMQPVGGPEHDRQLGRRARPNPPATRS